MPDTPLSGRVAVVTGVSRRQGIAAAVARRLVADGAAVLLTGHSAHDAGHPWGAEPQAAAELVAGLRRDGGRVEHVEADLADPVAPAALLDRAGALGHVDILVAAHARSSNQDLAGLTSEELDRSFAVNTRSTLLLVQALAAQHDGRPGGRVVLFTSGQHAGAMPDELPYAASKAVLHQLTPSLAVALAPQQITVNCLDPGPTDTGWADPATRAAVARGVPAGRWGTPQDAARAVAWLVGPQAGWVTGQRLASDGGWSAV